MTQVDNNGRTMTEEDQAKKLIGNLSPGGFSSLRQYARSYFETDEKFAEAEKETGITNEEEYCRMFTADHMRQKQAIFAMQLEINKRLGVEIMQGGIILGSVR